VKRTGRGHDAAAPDVTVRPTPILIAPRTRNVLVFAGLVLLLLVLWYVPALPAVVLGGFALALLLSFPVRLLSRWMPRPVAIVASIFFVVGTIVLASLLILPVLTDQFRSFVSAVPAFARDAEVHLRGVLEWLHARGILFVEPELISARVREDLTNFATASAGTIAGGLAGFVTGTFSVALILFGMIFVGIYLLVDARQLEAAYLRAAPAAYRRDARVLWDAIGMSGSRYLGGLALILLIQGALSALALYILGVPYALLLGAWVSITAIVPIVGAFLGAVPAVLVALTVSPTAVVLTIVLFAIIQQF
jgi:predicted PurR-regulated permease PerM